MVEGLAGPERTHSPVAEIQGRHAGVPRHRTAALDERDDALVRRRPAAADAGAARDDRADDQLLSSAHTGILGADRCDLGRGEPHHRTARNPGPPEVTAGGGPYRGGGLAPLQHATCTSGPGPPRNR